jgi:hypothetical protein
MKNEVDDADDNLGAAAEAQEAPENKDDGKDIDKKYKESLERAIRELRQSDRLDMDKIGLSSPKFYEIMTKLSGRAVRKTSVPGVKVRLVSPS